MWTLPSCRPMAALVSRGTERRQGLPADIRRHRRSRRPPPRARTPATAARALARSRGAHYPRDGLTWRAPETWMIGDNLEWEVEVPQRLGIYAIWMDAHGEGLPPGSTVKPDRIIRSLSELLP